MLLTKQQIAQLKQIVQDASTALAISSFGYELPTADVQRLVDDGWIDQADIDRLTDDSYHAGVVTSDDPGAEKDSLVEIQRKLRVNPVKLSEVEERAMGIAQERAGQYAVGLGNRWSASLGRVVVDADQELAQRTRKIIRDETATAVAERKTRQELATRLGQMTEDWSRDWDRIAATELQAAHQEAYFEASLERHGEDGLMARVPDPGACRHCRRLYLEDGKPMVRPLSWWADQGTSNAGLKQADWKPVYGPIHPWCRCQSVRVPKGFEVDESGSLEPIEKSMDPSYVPSALEGYKEFKKPKLKWRGLTIRLENEEGDIRGWYDPNEAKSGYTLMDIPYGYIENTKGADGDEVDVYMGRFPAAENVYIVHQMKAPTFKEADEDKVMIGFKSRAEAVRAYLAHYNDSRFLGSVTAMKADDFVKRVKKADGEMIKGLGGIGYSGPAPVGRVVSGGSKMSNPKTASRHVIDMTLLMEMIEEAAKGKRPKLIVDTKRFDFGFDILTPPHARPKRFAEHLIDDNDHPEIEDNRRQTRQKAEGLVAGQVAAREVQRWAQVKR
jgi:hypothetical protein